MDPCLDTLSPKTMGLLFYLHFPAYSEVVCKHPGIYQPPLGMSTSKTGCWLDTGITGAGGKDGLCHG